MSVSWRDQALGGGRAPNPKGRSAGGSSWLRRRGPAFEASRGSRKTTCAMTRVAVSRKADAARCNAAGMAGEGGSSRILVSQNKNSKSVSEQARIGGAPFRCSSLGGAAWWPPPATPGQRRVQPVTVRPAPAAVLSFGVGLACPERVKRLLQENPGRPGHTETPIEGSPPQASCPVRTSPGSPSQRAAGSI